MIRLVVADARPVVREGLKRIVSECRDMRLVAETGKGDGALEVGFAAEADVLLLGDIAVSTPKTVDLVRDLQRRHPKLRVLVLGVHDEDRYAVRVLRAGAAGYLTTDLSPGQLVEAIRRVAGARRYLSPTLAQKLVFAEQVRGGRSRHAGLSDREYEVLRLFGSGKSFKHIAAELGVSPKTVSTYRTRILHKLHLDTNAGIIRYAIENRLVE